MAKTLVAIIFSLLAIAGCKKTSDRTSISYDSFLPPDATKTQYAAVGVVESKKPTNPKKEVENVDITLQELYLFAITDLEALEYNDKNAKVFTVDYQNGEFKCFSTEISEVTYEDIRRGLVSSGMDLRGYAAANNQFFLAGPIYESEEQKLASYIVFNKVSKRMNFLADSLEKEDPPVYLNLNVVNPFDSN